jgi:hypothetical protein
MPNKCTHVAGEPRVFLEWQEEFEAAARRPLEQRLRYAFIHTYKPVLDDAPFRAFGDPAAVTPPQ